jgi:hypothetical protein
MFLVLGITILNAEEFTTGGVYVQVATTNSICNLIGRTTNHVEPLIIGKTYRLETDLMEIKTKIGETIILALSTGLQVKVSPNSSFSVDTFNQLVVNNESQPALLKSEYAITALSLLDGDIEVICPKIDTNSQCILQTPLVNLTLTKCKLSIRSNLKYVILNAIEGGVTVVDSKNKQTFIDKGNLGLIIQYPGREGEIMVTQKAISPDELQKTTKSIDELENYAKEVLFVVMDKKVIGIRLK